MAIKITILGYKTGPPDLTGPIVRKRQTAPSFIGYPDNDDQVFEDEREERLGMQFDDDPIDSRHILGDEL